VTSPRAIGLSRSTAALRVQRLLTSGQVVVACRSSRVIVAVRWPTSVSPCGAGCAAGRGIARRDDVPFLSLTSGQYGLVARCAPRPRATSIARSPSLRSLDGVTGVDTLTYVEVVRDVIGPVGDVAPTSTPST